MFEACLASHFNGYRGVAVTLGVNLLEHDVLGVKQLEHDALGVKRLERDALGGYAPGT
jgi:hypothetical protein